MITFCFLAAQGGCEPQLTSHAAANMKIGNDKAFLIRVISQCLPYIGYPRSLNALACVNKAAEMAVQKEATKGQISLAWMLCKKPYIIPIPGSRKESRIKENLGSKDIVLSAEEIQAIDELLDQMALPVYGQNRTKK